MFFFNEKIITFSLGFISNLTIQRQYFPNDEDQTGAAKALLRLQDTYQLDTQTISSGDLPGECELSPFSKHPLYFYDISLHVFL